MTLKEVIFYLQKKLKKIPQLKNLKYENQEYNIWYKELEYELKKQFGEHTDYYKIVFGDRNFPGPFGFSRDPVQNAIYQQKQYLSDLSDLETNLKTLLRILKRERKKYNTQQTRQNKK